MNTLSSPLIFHSTYFKLKDGGSADTQKSYIDACREYLSTSDGMMSFWVGAREREMTRPVNDCDFDVAMHQVFKNKDAFETYNGKDPKHEQFVAEVNRWAAGTTRRVLDSYLSQLCYISASDSAELHSVVDDASLPVRLMHSVYFKLTNKSDEFLTSFTAICVKLLSGHDGECVFAIGKCANPLKRDINVQNFDVVVNIEWANKDFYERYLGSPDHEEFFPATKGMIKDTYVFDSSLR